MVLQRLKRTQYLKSDMKTCWNFFSDPKKLAEITPEWLGFRVVSDLPEKMYSGLIIEYKITPLAFLETSWVTEITHISEPFFFVDEQRLGPCKFWHHKHFFEKSGGGVIMTDEVHYSLPFGIIGDILNRFVIRKKLDNIFNYRFETLKKLF
ncbi:MAG: SRPBCC family protein [Flexistipes sinusarabici]|uniref:SRPBCC family protein n=1 Tax=Flexistipes sinusarabici TaxID=2352 RepID=A0A5D0MNI2_FLESI|nr:SRPBCC family protein [Flexistipes sinusarabici]TYB35227.1 MAG: SRPBCC family protein [Flexistipes sinusarabici]